MGSAVQSWSAGLRAAEPSSSSAESYSHRGALRSGSTRRLEGLTRLVSLGRERARRGRGWTRRSAWGRTAPKKAVVSQAPLYGERRTPGLHAFFGDARGVVRGARGLRERGPKYSAGRNAHLDVGQRLSAEDAVDGPRANIEDPPRASAAR